VGPAADDTLVRLRAATPLRDVRTLAEVERLFAPHGFSRIHTTWVVKLRRERAGHLAALCKVHVSAGPRFPGPVKKLHQGGSFKGP
jgi:hypothetical protein